MTGPATASPPSGRRAARAAAAKAAAGTAAATPGPTGAAGPSATPVPWPSGGRRLLHVPVPLLLWIELLLATVLVGLVRRDAVLGVAGVLVLVTAVLGLARRRRTPLHRLLGTWWRFRARRKQAAREAGPAGDAVAAAVAAAPLQALLPRLDVTSATLRGERRFGVCFDGSGWVAVLELEPPAQVAVPHAWTAGVPLGLLAGLLAVDDIRLSGAQVLVRTVPSPVAGADGADSPAATSYLRIRPVAVCALRQTWIALRLDADRARDAVQARGGGVTGAHRSLKRVVGRALELLEASGVRARVLEEAPLRDVLTGTLAGPLGTVGPSGTAGTVDLRAGEDWRWWRCAGRAHLTWWASGWPPGPDPVEPAVQLLQAAQPSFGLVSLAVHATDDPDDGPVARLLLRAVTPVGDAPTLAAALEGSAASAGLALRRLDGDHGPGTCATLPLGGGTR